MNPNQYKQVFAAMAEIATVKGQLRREWDEMEKNDGGNTDLLYKLKELNALNIAIDFASKAINAMALHRIGGGTNPET